MERAQDLLDEEEVEKNLEWDDYIHITDDEDIADGASGIDPHYGLNALKDDVKPIDTDKKTGRKLVYRWGDMTPPPTDTSLDTLKGVKRSAKKSLHGFCFFLLFFLYIQQIKVTTHNKIEIKIFNTWTNTNTQPDNTKQQIPVQNSARHDVISPEPWTY